jgi:hypothetical protein
MVQFDPITTCVSLASRDRQPTQHFIPGNGMRFACSVSRELQGTARARSSVQLTMVAALRLTQYKRLWRAIWSCFKQWTLDVDKRYLSLPAKRRQYDKGPFYSRVIARQCRINVAVINTMLCAEVLDTRRGLRWQLLAMPFQVNINCFVAHRSFL